MGRDDTLFYILQLAGGTFPTGSFSQSWGLETYVSQNRIRTTEELAGFLNMYLEEVVAKFEGPSLSRAWELALPWDGKGLMELEEVLTAMKLTKESKEASHRTGKALLRIACSIIADEELQGFYENYGKAGISYSLAYGMLTGRLGMGKREALASYVFSTINGLVQSAVKLIPLGNIEAQKVLLQVYGSMGEAVEKSLYMAIEDISNFCPGLDIASMIHENLTVRLYMS